MPLPTVIPSFADKRMTMEDEFSDKELILTFNCILSLLRESILGPHTAAKTVARAIYINIERIVKKEDLYFSETELSDEQELLLLNGEVREKMMEKEGRAPDVQGRKWMENERVAKYVKHIAQQKKEGWKLPSKSVGNVKEERPRAKMAMKKNNGETADEDTEGADKSEDEKGAQDAPVHERPSAGTMVVKTQKLVIHLITPTTGRLYGRKAMNRNSINEWIESVRQESSKQKGRQY